MNKQTKNNSSENKIFFTVIVVCYNAAEKLKQTLDSVYSQEYWEYRVIIKDGGSTDGSLRGLKASGYFKERYLSCTTILEGSDKGIYDAMNIAVDYVNSNNNNYIIFMNCGDVFYSRQTLGKVADFIDEHVATEPPYIFYGNQFNRRTNTVVSSFPKLNEFSLYRNVPCHQVCFYDSRLFKNRSYDTSYKVRADYEHFLYCVYKENANTVYIDEIISDYEGGGFSETKKNREISAIEHREITDKYMGSNAAKYRRIMILSGAGLRTALAESKSFSGIYNKIKGLIYKIKQ